MQAGEEGQHCCPVGTGEMRLRLPDSAATREECIVSIPPFLVVASWGQAAIGGGGGVTSAGHATGDGIACVDHGLVSV
jgi:hypothetical protein